MFVATIVLSAVLALLFAAGGAGKLAGVRRQVETARHLNIPWQRFQLIGIPEIAASGGLLAGLAVAPLGVAAASGLVLLMAGALGFRVRAHDRFPFLLGDAVFLLLAATTAVLRIVTA
jgi:hypothetical protein